MSGTWFKIGTECVTQQASRTVENFDKLRELEILKFAHTHSPLLYFCALKHYP